MYCYIKQNEKNKILRHKTLKKYQITKKYVYFIILYILVKYNKTQGNEISFPFFSFWDNN